MISKQTYPNLNSETIPSTDPGQSVTTPVASALALLPQWDRIQAFLFSLRGGSKPFSVAVSQCVFASRYPFVLMCQQVYLHICFHCVPTGAMKCVRASSGGMNAALTTAIGIVLCGISIYINFICTVISLLYVR